MMSERDRIALDEAISYTNMSWFRYILRFIRNWLLERLASNFPVPEWRAKFHRMRGVKIGHDVYIGYDVIFDRIHPELITVEDYAEIGDRCIISVHSRGTLLLRDRYPRTVQPVKIGKGAWIAPGCIIIQGVEIGEKSIIGTGAVVTKSIPPNCLAVGVPAKVVKNFNE